MNGAQWTGGILNNADEDTVGFSSPLQEIEGLVWAALAIKSRAKRVYKHKECTNTHRYSKLQIIQCAVCWASYLCEL